MKLLALVPLAFSLVPLISAQISSIYWPITQPSKEYPWVIGEKNYLLWQTGGGTGIQVFDIQLHNRNRTIMTGFLPIALRVPMEKISVGPRKGQWGGEIEVDLADNMPTGPVEELVRDAVQISHLSTPYNGSCESLGDGFTLIFMNTLHGQVYAKSPLFPIFPKALKPDNYTAPPVPTATVIATLTELPNPTQQWALTLNGENPIESKQVVYAGNAGSGGGV